MIRNQNARCVVVVGGQYGSEGKGKVVADIVRNHAGRISSVRCGGPNSGHTTIMPNGEEVILKALPAGVANPNAQLLIPAGSVVKIPQLIEEINRLDIDKRRLIVDPECVLWHEIDPVEEAAWTRSMGSTGSGNGAALIRRMKRTREEKVVYLVRDLAANMADGDLPFTVARVADIVNCNLQSECPVIVEGNQGFGLSMLHSGHWPFCTSRDTTASGFLSEIGLSPFAMTDCVMCVRTFPIRVGGNSGPMKNEITWQDVARLGGGTNDDAVMEYTSVTQRLRRVGKWDQELFERAIAVNRPTALAVLGMDRYDLLGKDVSEWADLPQRSKDFLIELFDSCDTPIRWIGSGPKHLSRLTLPDGHFWSYWGQKNDRDDLLFDAVKRFKEV